MRSLLLQCDGERDTVIDYICDRHKLKRVLCIMTCAAYILYPKISSIFAFSDQDQKIPVNVER